MKTITFDVKADLKPFEKKMERIQAIQLELEDILAEYAAAIKDLTSTNISFKFDPDESEDETDDLYSFSPYEYPDEFDTEKPLDPFKEFGADITQTPFANVIDIEGLG